MKTYDIARNDGDLAGFEISNLLIGRRGVCRLLGSLSGVRITRRPRALSWFRDDGVFCEFELEGRRFFVEEPFGDNSRYFVAAVDNDSRVQLERIRDCFIRATPFRYIL